MVPKPSTRRGGLIKDFVHLASTTAPWLSVLVTLMIGACGANEFGEGRPLRELDKEGSDAGHPVEDAGQTINVLPHATVGGRCGTGTYDRYIVLSAVPADCARHAELLEADDGTPVVYARLPRTTGQVEVMATVCLDLQDCQQRPVTFFFEGWTEGAGATGRWEFELPSGANAQGTFEAAWCEYDEFVPDAVTTQARDITIDSVKVLQGTTVTVVEDGQAVADRNAPVVEARRALVRVFVRPLTGFLPRTIVARMTVDTGDGTEVRLPAERREVTGPSQDDNISSTFNFDLSGSAMTADLEWKVELLETSACTAPPVGDTAQAQYPADGSLEPMGAVSMGTTFNVVLVPVRYDADGSRRLPDLSGQQIERYRRTMLGQYPIADLNLTVRAPFPYDEAVSDTSASWSALLSAIYTLKGEDNPPPNTFYYGLVVPASTFSAYCTGVCTVGVGPNQPGPSAVMRRAAVGLGYPGQASAETFTHEIGHATGRLHAPCEVTDPDPAYPTGPTYANGGLGVYGYNILNGSLYGPTAYADIMGYCNPTWISDYNYAAIFERVQFVNNASMFTAWAPRTVRMAVVDDIEAQWGGPAFVVREPIQDPVAVQFEDATGRVLGVEMADRIELDHADEPLYVLPMAAPAEAVQVRLPSGQTLPLSADDIGR